MFQVFEKILKPRVAVVDGQGSVVADHLAGRNPLVIEWSGVAPADGGYFLIVAADKEKPAATVLTVKSPVPGYTGMTVPVGMASAPFGKVISYFGISRG